MEHYKLYCCGSRGSEPIEGTKFNEFGGYTSCYILKKKNYALVIDCGTGLYAAKTILKDCKNIDVIFTHLHYDHILGLLDLSVFEKGCNLNFYGKFKNWYGEKSLEEFFRHPFWPISPNYRLHEAPENNNLILNESLNVSFFEAPHPDESSLLVIEDFSNASVKTDKVVVMFDAENSTSINDNLIQYCDILIYDGMYDDDEYLKHKGWGHSTWQEGCRLANRVHARQLIITHHEPKRTDEQLRSFETSARMMFANTDFARAGQTWYVNEENKETNTEERKKTKGSLKEMISEIQKYVQLALVDTKEMRHFSCMVSCAALGIISFGMTLVNVATMKIPVLYATAIFTLVCAINTYIYLKAPKLNFLANTLFKIEIIALITFFLISGSPEGFSAIWALLIPTTGMLVFGRAETSAVSAVIMIIMIFLFRTDIGRGLLMYSYTESFLLRFPLAFFAFYAIAFVVETIRRKTLNMLIDTKESQEKMIASQTLELKDQNYELTNANSRLEARSQLLYKTFGKLLPDEIVTSLLSNDGQPDFAGKKKTITALQADIRGFTAMTSHMDALSVMKMLNRYLSEMTNIIQENNGIITEFIGDGILAVFGGLSEGENHTEEAVLSALQMQNAVKEINLWNKTNGYPEIEIGIGINTGEAVLGAVGGQQRLKFDAIGSTINIASRIESYATGLQILIGEETYRSISDSLIVKNSYKVFPKGLDNEIAVYDVVGFKGQTPIFISSTEEPINKLEKEIKVNFHRIVDDHNDLKAQKGSIVALSDDSLILKTKVSMALFDNVRIDYEGGIIGKVVAKKENHYTIRISYKGTADEKKAD